MPGTAAVIVVGAYVAHETIEAQEDQMRTQEAATQAQIESDTKKASLEKKRADLRTARERARAVREARAARGAALASAQSGEGTGGSGLSGAQAQIGSQLNEGIAFMNANQRISNRISSLNLSAARTQAGFQRKINRSQGDINTLAAVGSIADSAGDVFAQ